MAAGSGSIAGIGWVFWCVVGSGSVSTVGIGAGSGFGVVMDGKWGWTLLVRSPSTLPTVKEDHSTHKLKFTYLANVQ